MYEVESAKKAHKKAMRKLIHGLRQMRKPRRTDAGAVELLPSLLEARHRATQPAAVVEEKHTRQSATAARHRARGSSARQRRMAANRAAAVAKASTAQSSPIVVGASIGSPSTAAAASSSSSAAPLTAPALSKPLGLDTRALGRLFNVVDVERTSGQASAASSSSSGSASGGFTHRALPESDPSWAVPPQSSTASSSMTINGQPVTRQRGGGGGGGAATTASGARRIMTPIERQMDEAVFHAAHGHFERLLNLVGVHRVCAPCFCCTEWWLETWR